MKSPDEITELYINLEKLGLKQVETQLAQRVYGNPKKKLVENWIKTQKEDLNNEHKNRGVAIAKEANKIAKKSNQISWWSFIASIFSLLIAILVAIFK